MPNDVADESKAGGRRAAEGRRKVQFGAVTAVYDPVEDRVRLNAQTKDGEKHTILLTRRLLDRLVPAFVGQMETRAPRGRMKDVMLSMAQETARQARAEAPRSRPVATTAATPARLCTAVHLTKVRNGLVVGFSDGKDFEGVLPAVGRDANAFLDIISRVYAKAGWSREVFPDWVALDDDGRATVADKILN